MLKSLALIAAVLVVAAAAGCGFLRDLSTPSARLVGHWTTDQGDEYYFGRPIAGEGTLVYLPRGGEKETQTYRVVEESDEDDTVTVEVTTEDGTTVERVYRIPEDGIFMREQTENVPEGEETDYIFVDTATQPAPYQETAQAEAED